jgi:AraC family transcriptional regulator of adaptative response / DNA-3-methyladenine glycosylase II
VKLNSDQCYAALVARDPRFDGRFFVGVKSTGIYCRPICRVKTPLRKSCDFFSNAPGAEAAGFRPCKRCRPELAPGNRWLELTSELARDAANQINQDYLAEHSLADLAGYLGVTDRQLRRAFHGEFGVSPVQFAQTQRLLLAKQLLTDSHMPVTAVALASGFKSLRRFNALMKAHYRMSPTELRKRPSGGLPANFAEFPFRLSYRAPYDWPKLLNFLSKRAMRGVEVVAGDTYFRTVQVRRTDKSFTGYIEVRNDTDTNALLVRLSQGLLPVCAQVLERLKWVFDLHADPAAINQILGSLAAKQPGLRLLGSCDGFETAVRAVLGQQVSVAAATTFAGRLVERFGSPVETPVAGLNRLFPLSSRMAALSAEEIGQAGITRSRCGTLIALAAAVAGGNLKLEPGRGVEETLRKVREIQGMGEWTAEHISMRALSWPDAFPHTDLGVKRALGLSNPRQILALAEKWRPWRAYAALHLWQDEPSQA